MALQWFPGHMTKARRELAERMTSVDLVIEVLDARMPLSSRNPLVRELRGGKPFIEVLTRSDLADPAVTRLWLDAPSDDPARVAVIACSNERPPETRSRLFALLDEQAKRRPGKSLRLLIAGIPNVGKSTLINTLMNRTVAAVSDRPAVTKQQQRVELSNGMSLTDTPGLMSPKIEDEAMALRLALGGAIPATAVDYETIALAAAPYLLAQYGALLDARFKLGVLPTGAEALLEAIGARRGFRRLGGGIDLHKASEVLVNEFRSGKLGRISLERPAPPVASAPQE
jgi:ribosome biogenesis GTPase A